VTSRFFSGDAVPFAGGLGEVGDGIGMIGLLRITGLVVDDFHCWTPILAVAALLPVFGTVACLGSADRFAE
jgi:hypothetical protein